MCSKMDTNLFLFAIFAVFVSTVECQLFPKFGTLNEAVRHIVHPQAKPTVPMIELALKHLIGQKYRDHLNEFTPHFLQLAIDMGVHQNDTRANKTEAEKIFYEKGLQWLMTKLHTKLNGQVEQQKQVLRHRIMQILFPPSRMEDMFERMGLDIDIPPPNPQAPMGGLGLPNSFGAANEQTPANEGETGQQGVGAGMRILMPFGAIFGPPKTPNSMPGDLYTTILNSMMGGANMERPTMGGANMQRPAMGGANMQGPTIGGANKVGPMGGSTMGGANMAGPMFGGANMGGPLLGGADMGGLFGGNMGGPMGGSIMGGANMGPMFGGADFGGLFGGADMGGPMFGGADMGGLFGGNMGGPMMGGANMGGPLFGGAPMGGPMMLGGNMGGPMMLGGPNMGGQNRGGGANGGEGGEMGGANGEAGENGGGQPRRGGANRPVE